MEGVDFATGGKIAGGLVATGIAIMKFFSRFQTKGGCKKAHSEHDKLDIERQKTRDEKLGRIHDSVERIENLVMTMAGERLKDSRRGD